MIETTPLASQSTHWYLSEDCSYGKRGAPCYTTIGKNGKERNVTLRDLKAGMPIVPSVTSIQKCAAQYNLEQWKLKQLLMSALTLPRIDGESEDDYATRVIADSKEQGQQAADRGTECHAAIERYAGTGVIDPVWGEHVEAVRQNLEWAGINLSEGTNEHSFVSPLGYGGKVDWHIPGLVVDFKTKDRIDMTKKLAWDNHAEQLAAYGHALFRQGAASITIPTFRAINVFIGVTDCKVIIVEHEWKDLVRGWNCFRALLDYWRAKNL